MKLWKYELGRDVQCKHCKILCRSLHPIIICPICGSVVEFVHYCQVKLTILCA